MTGEPGGLPWPVEHLRVVGRTYREAAGRRVPPLSCIETAEAARVVAGGEAEHPATTTRAMINHLSREHGDWLFGPAQEWLDRQRTPELDGEIFDPPEHLPW